MRGLPTILPTTKQVVGNGHLQTDLDGKNKKALYFQCSSQGNTRLLRHSWTCLLYTSDAADDLTSSYLGGGGSSTAQQ